MSDPESRVRAGDVLRRRYVRGDPARAAAVERERLNAEVARLIHQRRTEAGLTQKDLAERIGTRQSVISRLESADYDGHSLTMVQRIAEALGLRVTVAMAGSGPDPSDALPALLRALRRRRSLTIDQLAAALGVERERLAAMERGCVVPDERLLAAFSDLFDIPGPMLHALAAGTLPDAAAAALARFRHATDESPLAPGERDALDGLLAALRASSPPVR